MIRTIVAAVVIWGLILAYLGFGVWLSWHNWNVPLSEVRVGPFVAYLLLCGIVVAAGKMMGGDA